MDSSTGSPREQGIQALRAGRLDEALALLAQAVRADGQDAEAQAFLGVAYSQQGLHTQALQALRSAVALQPQNSQYRFNLEVALERAQDAAARARLEGEGPAALAPLPAAAEPIAQTGEPSPADAPGLPGIPPARPAPPGNSHVPDPRSKDQRRADIDHELARRRALIQRIRADAAQREVSLTHTEIQEALQKTLQEEDMVRAQPESSSGSRPAGRPDQGLSWRGVPESSILTTVGCLAWYWVPVWMVSSFWFLRKYDFEKYDAGVNKQGAMGFGWSWMFASLPLAAVAVIVSLLAGKWVASGGDQEAKWLRFIMVLLYVLVLPAVVFLIFVSVTDFTQSFAPE
jgi:hypothetical protein